MTFEFKDLKEAIRIYTNEKRWGSSSGLWCCQFPTLCVVVETQNYLPINIWAIGLTTKYSTAGQLMAEIEEAIWELCHSHYDMLGYNAETFYHGFDLLMGWPKDLRLLMDPFATYYGKEDAIAVMLKDIDYG